MNGGLAVLSSLPEKKRGKASGIIAERANFPRSPPGEALNPLFFMNIREALRLAAARAEARQG
jgi:hypothetical protein